MQIVIDIPEDVYTRLFDNGRPMDIADGIVIDRAIRKGTPLPKGHGRLIDADIVNEMLNSLDGCTAELDKAFNVIDTTPTVLEGSKE